MKKIFITSFLCLIVTKLSSQTHKITYERKANIEYQLRHVVRPDIKERVAKRLANDTVKFELISKDSISVYSRKTDEYKDTDTTMYTGIIDSIYKNKQLILLLKNASLNDTLFLIKDSLPNYDWSETGKSKDILDYSCKQIKANVNDEEFTAWYTTEIPISDGPDIFWIQQGLILEIDTKNHIISAINVEVKNESDLIIRPSKGEEITLAEYRKKLNDFKDSIFLNNIIKN